MSAADSEAAGRDLVVLALSGVQRFISESRATSDLSSASQIVAWLAERAGAVCQELGASIVFPAQPDASGVAGRVGGRDEAAGVPNRVVALVPGGAGAQVAGQAAAVVRSLWAGWVREVLGREVDTPGIPSVQWVCAPASLGGYAEQWRQATGVLQARKRIRDFPEVDERRRDLCSLSPRWPAVPDRELPAGLAEHEQDRLSAANWVKRLWRTRLGGSGRRDGFPSTSAIASATFRREVLQGLDDSDDAEVRGAVGQLRGAVERLTQVRETPIAGLRGGDALAEWFRSAAGRWVYPDTWQEEVLKREHGLTSGEPLPAGVAEQGRTAAQQLQQVMKDSHGVEKPTAYLALLAQDLDGMGRFLSGEETAGRRIEVTVEQHRRVSQRLGELAWQQRDALRGSDLLGVPVYAGGDDLFAFVPAATALAAARTCQDLVPVSLPTASTAVLFFHHRSSLRRAVAEVRALLDEAKDTAAPRKHALAVGYLRHSGVREHSIQPWTPRLVGGLTSDGKTAAELFGVFSRRPQANGSAATGACENAGAERGTGAADAKRAARQPLSPRLVIDLERDARELASLPDGIFRTELERLVIRHGGTGDDATALARLGKGEYATSAEEDTGGPRPLAAAARVAVFIRQECR